ncbi:MAG TPA: FHA domain-containing protein [Gemmatimonadaceae bacterium]|nr:FHA domain-containing protein [Gemmatimonadaceae bacterium]
MTYDPKLVPVAPTQGAPTSIALTPFWIGSAPGSALQLQLPRVAPRHVAVMEREDGFYLSPVAGVSPAPTLNGRAVSGLTRMQNGDVIEIVPGTVWRLETGEPLPVEVEEAGDSFVPVAGRSGKKKKKRKMRRGGGGGRGRSIVVGFAVLALVALLVVAGVVVYRGATHESQVTPLSDTDAALFDSLLLVSYDHMERGSTLLDLGLSDQALQEFARSTNVIETSRLRDNPWVKPRIAALEATVGEIYRTRSINVPSQYKNAKATVSIASSLKAQLSAADFETRFLAMQTRFSSQFHRQVVVTGRDHPEHLSLYGRGGAIDMRVNDLSREQVQWIVANCRAAGIRVKDFSTDSVLQAQIQNAIKAGLSDRAGTGVHLHVDRFADRHDKYTVS